MIFLEYSINALDIQKLKTNELFRNLRNFAPMLTKND